MCFPKASEELLPEQAFVTTGKFSGQAWPVTFYDPAHPVPRIFVY